jgi:hypothetical protein
MKRSHDFTGKKGQKVSDKTMGPWSVHNEENEQGKLVREMAEDLDLVAVSSFFRPCRKYGGAGTWQAYGDQKDYPIATLDYVFLSRRWRSCCLNVQPCWGPSEHRFASGNGVRKDHAFLKLTIRLRLAKAEKVHRPDRKY